MLKVHAVDEVLHLIGPPGGQEPPLATAADLVGALAKAEREGTLRERIRFFCRPQLLIVDEIGYLSVVSLAAATCSSSW